MTTARDFELLIPASDWQQAVMPLFSNRNRWETGRLQFLHHPERTEFVLKNFTPGLTGRDYPPLSTWLAVAAPDGGPPDSPRAWMEQLQPLFGQTLVLLLVGFGPDRSGWRGWVIENQIVPLTGFRLIGPGMVETPREPEPFTDDLPERWNRLQGAVGERVYEKLRRARVALVGCSRTGTLAATMLNALGVEQLRLIDGDLVEAVNLDGMVTVSPTTIGEPKVLALGRALVSHRPDLMLRAIPKKFDAAFPEPSQESLDLLVTCTDSDSPRLRAAHWCNENLVPHLDIGTGVTMEHGERVLAADVRLLLPRTGACVACVGGLVDRDQAKYDYYAPPGALPRRPEAPWNAGGRLGSLITLNSLAVATGVQSWLDLLGGTLTASIWHRLRWQPGQGIESRTALVGGNTCGVCGQ